MPKFIKPCVGRVTSPFGWRTHPIKKVRSWHQGVDIAEKGNVPILAAADGVVTRIGPLGTYGNVVMIVHKINGKTYETNYAHLKPNLKVLVGQQVKQGDIIAYMGNTGGSTGQHLHFEIHDGRWATGQPNAVDPLLYLCFPEVVEIQKQLNKVGYKLIVDGIEGPNTESAIKDFQKKHKLIVDGSAGSVTLAAVVKEIIALSKPLPKPIVTPVSKPKEKESARMFKPSTKTLENEMVSFLELAHKNGILTSDEWAKKAKDGTLTLDDAVALQAKVFRRSIFEKT